MERIDVTDLIHPAVMNKCLESSGRRVTQDKAVDQIRRDVTVNVAKGFS